MIKEEAPFPWSSPGRGDKVDDKRAAFSALPELKTIGPPLFDPGTVPLLRMIAPIKLPKEHF